RKKDALIPSMPAREDKRDPKNFPSPSQDLMKTVPEAGPFSAPTDPFQRRDLGARPPQKTSTPPPSSERKTEPAIPDLFSGLTRDLGLGVPAREQPQTRVEVTQVIRRRGVRPRSPSELASIEGPIVDTTQPGQIQEVSTEITSPASVGEPPPLF